jgi:beta-galactosidase/beta-glucuronidase
MPTDMLTRWGRELDPDHVLPEYPRPQLVRDSYLNLNGRWSYAFTPAEGPGATTAPAAWDGEILVPFSPEAPLSGVGRQLQPDELLWYHRLFSLPAGFTTRGTDRVLLHFGAVDQTCTVWVNDVEVGRNQGGYLPFTCDVTEALREGDNVLVVRVRDLSDGRGPSSGKQRLDRGKIWYTAQSGIWQTVWVEAVPASYVEALTLTPLLDEGAVEVTVHAAGAPVRRRRARVTVSADGVELAQAKVAVGQPTVVPLGKVRPWSPEDPFLHDVEVTLGKDVVRSYVGIRSFGTGPDEDGVPRLLLNGKPYLHVGVLDQGYWPDGLLTAPSDEALVHDVATMKAMGFTMLRKHIKVESLRWYHHCDRLGMLVWQDFVNGGGKYKPRVMRPPELRRMGTGHFPDHRYKLFAREDKRGRREFLRETRRTVSLLRNVPSLAGWVPFNEGWGQFDANDVTEQLRRLDPTRPIDQASGWHDQGGGDLWSLHVYGRPFTVPSRGPEEHRVLVLSEYGGYDLDTPGHQWSGEHFGYQHYETADDLRDAFVKLHEEELAPAVRAGLSATVYTQVSDVEDEVNGLLTYDRELAKLPEAVVREALARLRLGS